MHIHQSQQSRSTMPNDSDSCAVTIDNGVRFSMVLIIKNFSHVLNTIFRLGRQLLAAASCQGYLYP